MKKISAILATLMLVFALGCSSSDAYRASSRSSDSSGFNQETYIWESIYFPTNRTSGAQ